jgi:hypothetical protein
VPDFDVCAEQGARDYSGCGLARRRAPSNIDIKRGDLVSLNLILSIAGAVILLFVVWKLTQKIITAVVFALIAAGVIYVVIPMLAEREDGVGETARSIKKAVETGEKKVKEVANDPRTKKLGRDVVKGAKDVVKKVSDSAAAETAKEKAEEAAAE